MLTPDKLPEEYSLSENAGETEGGGLAAGLARTARELSARLAQKSEAAAGQSPFGQNPLIEADLDNDIFEDDAAALRWRHALLRLSETFLDAAEERRDLSPILLGALHNALEQLLIHGEEADLMALEDWLSHEAPSTSETSRASGEEGKERSTADFLMAGSNGVYNGDERRVADRRSGVERRQGDRRS